MSNKIYVIMGKSGSGKDSVYEVLKEKLGDRVKSIVLYTTRPIRSGEIDGETYHFTDVFHMNVMRNASQIIEERVYHTVYGDWFYFTADDGSIDLENNSYLLIGTLEAYNSFKKYFGKDRVEHIYIEVPDGIRLTRALEREKAQEEPKYKEMCRRFIADADDFSEEKILESEIETRYQNTGTIEELTNKILENINI